MKYKLNGTWYDVTIPAYDSIPVGAIIPYAGSEIPDNYLLCDGRAVGRTSMARLFSVIGTTYGSGDGSTTFNLPNIKGRVLVGLDSTQIEFDTLGKTGGSKELQAHTHDIKRAFSPSNGFSTPYSEPVSGWGVISDGGGGAILTKTQDAGTGDSGNLQPYIVINYIIKAHPSAVNTSEVVNEHSTSETDVYSANYVNGLVEKNVIEGIISSNITMNGSSSDTQIDLIQNQKIGNKLSISNGRIVIGSGINAVRVSASVQYNGTSTGYIVIRIQLKRNNTYTQFGLLVGSQGNENTLASGLNLAQVQEGDEIRLVYNSPTQNTISKDATKIYVEAI